MFKSGHLWYNIFIMKTQKILIVTLLVIVIVLLMMLYRSTSTISGNDFIEVVTRGAVIDNSLENPEVGAYLHLKQQITNDDLFVVYKPFVNGKEADCLNPIDASGISVESSTTVEVRGKYLSKVNGQTPAHLMISTCESPTSYIKVVK